MTESIQDAIKKSGAPDYMVLVINEIIGAKDAIQAMQSELSQRMLSVSQREQVQQEREDAFVKAAEDLTEFANRIYGPTSELTKINSKLGAMEAAATNRDARYATQFDAINASQTRLKDWSEERYRDLDKRLLKVERSVSDLQKKVG